MKLLEAVRAALIVKQYAYKTEQTYILWIRKYLRYHLPKHPRDVGVDGVREYLVQLGVSPATQNQALAAIQFLYGVLGVDLGDVSVLRAKKEKHLPTVLTHDEAMRVIENLHGVYRIMGELMYGGGLRLMECLRLRVKDIDFGHHIFETRAGLRYPYHPGVTRSPKCRDDNDLYPCKHEWERGDFPDG